MLCVCLPSHHRSALQSESEPEYLFVSRGDSECPSTLVRVAGTTLALALQLWLNVCPLPASRRICTISSRHHDLTLIVFPYVVPLIEFFSSLGYAARHPEQATLTNSGMFCGLNHSLPGKISTIYSALLMIPTVFVECMILQHIYRNWYKSSYNKGRDTFAMMIRFALFTLFGIVGVIVSVLNLTVEADSAVVNILESLPPMSFVFIFGLQEDLVHVWLFWRQKPREKSTQTFSMYSTEIA